MRTSKPNITAYRFLNPADCVGKTVAGVGREFDRSLTFRFTDNTYLHIIALDEDYEDANILTSDDGPDAREALAAGLIDPEEHDRCLAAERTERDEYERAEFERLRRKFGDAPGV